MTSTLPVVARLRYAVPLVLGALLGPALAAGPAHAAAQRFVTPTGTGTTRSYGPGSGGVS